MIPKQLYKNGVQCFNHSDPVKDVTAYRPFLCQLFIQTRSAYMPKANPTGVASWWCCRGCQLGVVENHDEAAIYDCLLYGACMGHKLSVFPQPW